MLAQGFSWETQQSWRGFVRRRRFLAVVAPIDATQAADNTTIDGPTTADIEQLEMVDLNDEWTEVSMIISVCCLLRATLHPTRLSL